MFQALAPLLKQSGKIILPILKKAGPVLKKALKNKKVQEFTIGIISSLGTIAVEKILANKEMSVEKKLKLLDKLKKRGKITEEDYKKYYDRILNSL